MRDPSEQPLVDGLRRGDRAAFDAVYARHRPRVHGFLLRLAGRRDVAEDLLQETFMKLARAAPTLREDTDLVAWLFTVARNAHVSHRRWAALDLSRLVALGEHPDPPADPVDGPDERADAARAIARLERALASLSAASREVLLLVGVEGMEQERAAEILGLSYVALRQRLARARAQLAVALERIESLEHEPPLAGADMKNDDEDLKALRALPVRDVEPAVAADVRVSALAAFAATHGGARARVTFTALRLWSRFGVPVVLAGLVCVYLRWAFAATLSLYN